MLGAIMGDICGSPWEGGYCRGPEFELFHPSAQMTDDSVCSVAIADALLHHLPIADTLRNWCRRYPGLGYGSMFNAWVYRPSMGPYESWGNGGAMRCSACAWLAPSLQEAQCLAELTAGVTHNHPEGLRGARAVATAIWLARQGSPARDIAAAVSAQGYVLGRSTHAWAEREPGATDAEETVPLAIDCALAAHSVEDAIRRAVYIGGDSDTTASMAAAVAEARFGICESDAQKALSLITREMRDIVTAVYERAGAAMRVPDPVPSVATSSTSISWWRRLWSGAGI